MWSSRGSAFFTQLRLSSSLACLRCLRVLFLPDAFFATGEQMRALSQHAPLLHRLAIMPCGPPAYYTEPVLLGAGGLSDLRDLRVCWGQDLDEREHAYLATCKKLQGLELHLFKSDNWSPQ